MAGRFYCSCGPEAISHILPPRERAPSVSLRALGSRNIRG